MREAWSKAVSLGLGLAITTKEQAEKLVEELVRKGEVGRSESADLVNELVRKGQESKAFIEGFVKDRMEAAEEWRLSRRQDIERLEERLAAMEQRLIALETVQEAAGEPLIAPAEGTQNSQA